MLGEAKLNYTCQEQQLDTPKQCEFATDANKAEIVNQDMATHRKLLKVTKN
jgi:hypothetical protein